MAPADLERARRIAAAIDGPADKATALCVMAIALGPDKRSETAPMVNEAFIALAGATDAFPFGGGPIALSFLDAAVVAAPNDVDEYFWKALAMPGSTRNSFRNPHASAERLGAIGATCLLSQRFDAEVAAGFAVALAAETDAIVGPLGESRGNSEAPLLALAGLLAADPQSVEVVVKKWPAVVGGDSLATSDRARLTVGSMLMASPAKRNDRIAERFLHRWIIDKEDL